MKEVFSYGSIIIFFVILIILFVVVKIKSLTLSAKNTELYIKSFIFRIFCACFYIFYHFFVFSGKGGDSLHYFEASSQLNHIALTDFDTYLNIIFNNYENFSLKAFSYDLHPFITSVTELPVVKISSFFSFITFDTYLGIALLITYLCFLGSWKMYETLSLIYPDHTKVVAICTLFIPTVIFWSSSLSKDGLCMGALCFLFTYCYRIFFIQKNIFVNTLKALFFAFIIIKIKAYILIAFVPALLIWLFIYYRGKIKNNFLRQIATPVLLLLIVGVGYLLLQQLSGVVQKFALDRVVDEMVKTKNYLSKEGFAESAYNLGEIEPNINGVIKMIPSAIVVSLYRPFIWEAKKLVVLIAALESTLAILITLFVILKVGVFRFAKAIFKDPFLIFSLIFTLLFATVTGISSGNFGTLMRYKIPFIPFYFCMLSIIYVKYRPRKKNLLLNNQH